MGHNPSRNAIARAEMQRAAEHARSNRHKLAAARHLNAIDQLCDPLNSSMASVGPTKARA